MKGYLFSAANGGNGFVHYFGDFYGKDYKAYIIKGGPGCGKSTFMKRIANAAQEKGYTVLRLPCSSDPDSLDGVIISEKKIAVFDGTPPHTLEPNFPGALENIVNLCEFWDQEKLYAQRTGIIEETLKNRGFHTLASRYIRAAALINRENLSIQNSVVDFEKAEMFADALIKKYLPGAKQTPAVQKNCFLSGITPKGIISFEQTVYENCKKIVVIKDKFGAVSGAVYKKIAAALRIKGYESAVCRSFLDPDRIEHIIIPELSLAFVTENGFIKFETGARRIHARRFYNSSAVLTHKNKVRFNDRLIKELLESAHKTLACAKKTHDIMEKFYIDAVNFDRLDAFTKKFIEEKI